MKLVASNPVAMSLLFMASPCAAAANEVSDREIRLRRSVSHLGGDFAHERFPLAHRGLLTLLYEEDVDDMKEIERFLEISSSMSMSLAPTARIAPPGKTGSKDGKKSKSNKEAAKWVKFKDDKSKDGKSDNDSSEKLRKNDKSKDAKTVKETKGKEGIKRTKEGGEETKTKDKDKLVVAKKEKRHRALGVGLSEDRVLPSTGKSKDGKSKSDKSKLEKSKSGRREKKQVRKDNNKISLPLSSSEDQRDIPNVKVTSAPTSSSKVSKDKSDKVKSGSKGKAGSRKYTVRRRAPALESVEWMSDRRELGVGCMIGIIELSRTASNSKAGVRKNDGKSGKYDRSKSGEKSESGKSGGKSGKDGSNVGRHDRGLRRTEMGLYACEMSGSYTCCKEYGDMGDDPVCCKTHYTNKGNEDIVLLPGASSSTVNGKGSSTSDDNGKGGSTDNGKVDRSQSNDISAFSNQVIPPQSISTMINNDLSVSNDNV